MKNKKILTFLTITLIFGNLIGVTPVYAKNAVTAKENFFISFFHKVMKKFGFEKDKDQGNKTGKQEAKLTPPADGTPMPTPSGSPPKNRNQKQNRQTNEERLTQLVTDGKITEDQKTAILTKLEELQEEYSMDSLKDLTEEERKAKMEEMIAELKAWAEKQGIDEKYVMFQPEGNGPEGQNRPPMPTPTTS